jgi:hypothetical protein
VRTVNTLVKRSLGMHSLLSPSNKKYTPLDFIDFIQYITRQVKHGLKVVADIIGKTFHIIKIKYMMLLVRYLASKEYFHLLSNPPFLQGTRLNVLSRSVL